MQQAKSAAAVFTAALHAALVPYPPRGHGCDVYFSYKALATELCVSSEKTYLCKLFMFVMCHVSCVMCFQRCHEAGPDTRAVPAGDVCCLRREGGVPACVSRTGHYAAEVDSAYLELRGHKLPCRDL